MKNEIETARGCKNQEMQASFGSSIVTDREAEFREGGPNDQRQTWK